MKDFNIKKLTSQRLFLPVFCLVLVLLVNIMTTPDFFSISVRSPGGEVIPPVSGRLGQSLEYTFVYEKTRIRLDYQPVEAETGKEVAVLRFENPTQGIWTVIVIREGGNGSGNFNMWLPIRQFINGTAEFLQPNPETTLTSPLRSRLWRSLPITAETTAFIIIRARGLVQTVKSNRICRLRGWISRWLQAPYRVELLWEPEREPPLPPR